MPTEFAKMTSETLNEGMIRQIITFLTTSARYSLEQTDAESLAEADVLLAAAVNLERILNWKEPI